MSQIMLRLLVWRYPERMRTVMFDTFTAGDPDELLTTGEAAKLLSSSRQHVVNLCDRGQLPFSTVGSHRRVRRGDVDAIRTRTERLNREQRRSLWLAYAVAGRIVEHPEHAVAVARANLERLRGSVRGEALRWLDEWQRLLDGPIEELLRTLIDPSPQSRELRQNSPFAGVLSPSERERVLNAWRTNERDRRT